VGRPWEFRSPFSPYEELFVSSAHLRSGTALTNEGLLLGNMAFGSIRSLPRVDRLLCATHTKWFCARNVDLMRMLTLLEACVCVCYFVGADFPAVDSELRGFGAEGADWSKTPVCQKTL
jgi:hypothetical protein